MDPQEDNEEGGGDCVEPVVKITLSPNTPSPEPSDELSSDEDERSNICDDNNEDEDNNAASTEQEEKFKYPVNEVPTCIDFGIQDYLCRVQHETEFDLSSDTDTSYLGATPPHRFSDGEIDPIEAMPVLLDSQLRRESIVSLSGSVREDSSSMFPVGRSWKDPGLQRMLAKSASKDSMLSLHFGPGQPSNKFKALQMSHRHHPRPFKRNTSLPAAIFKTFLIENQSKSEVNSNHYTERASFGGSNNAFEKNSYGPGARLSKIDSISNSSQTDLQVCVNNEQERGNKLSSSLSPSTDGMSSESLGSNWNICTSLDLETEDVDNQPFTSDVEKRSLMIRHMRRLIRQDTVGNFAPPDFHI